MSKIVNGAKTIYYIAGAIGIVISTAILYLFFKPKKKNIDKLVDAATDMAENLTDVVD